MPFVPIIPEMKNFAILDTKLVLFSSHWCQKIFCFPQSCRALIRSLFRALLFRANPFYVQLVYFVTVSLFGYLALRITKLKSTGTSIRPHGFDLFFTSVSATTVSSMSSVEMEVFSNTQLVILTLLMFLGGEVFVSMLGLHFQKTKIVPKSHDQNDNRVDVVDKMNNAKTSFDQIELGVVTNSHLEVNNHDRKSQNDNDIKYNSVRFLCYMVLGYLLVVHIGGSSLVSLYITLIPSARKILQNRGIKISTFSIFTTVSTFTNCGFIPTNENMIVFKKNSGLLLLLIPQILLGNTLYAPCLRFLISLLEKVTKRAEFGYILKHYKELGLLSGLHSVFLVITASGFLVVQLILFCVIEWNSEGLDGLSAYQKFVASLFQTANTRHTGESVVDLSGVSSAILVLFVVMMYLPPQTTFLPTSQDSEESASTNGGGIRKPKKALVESLLFSQLSYLAIFVILICVTEREKMKEDPLNFNVLNVTIEVISAYGNVGFSTGYSCKRRLNLETDCTDAWYGFSGRWSTRGKFILIVVMFFGRLKKFSMKQGKAWNLS